MKTTWQYCVAGISIALLLTSCVDPQQKKINRAVDALSKVEASTDDWGKIAVSELNLIENTGQFKLTYDLDVSNYVNSAQNSVNAAASTDLETGFYMGLAAQAAITPPVNVSIPGTGSNTLPSNPIPNNASTALNNLASSNPLLNIRSLTPTGDLGESVRKGLNDKIAEQLLRLMANPPTNSDKQVVWGVMQVTCQPQRRTRSGYMGEFNVNLKYARKYSPPVAKGEKSGNSPTNGVPDKGPMNLMLESALYHSKFDSGTRDDGEINNLVIRWYSDTDSYEVNNSFAPSVLAVLPMMDTQMQELRHSDHHMLELASALSAAFSAKGLTASAQLMSDYVNRRQYDVDTRTATPVVTAYTDGQTFGVQIYPSLQALNDPAQGKSGAAQVLQSVSFPIVVALQVDKNDYEPGTNKWDQLWTQVRSRWIAMTPGGRSLTIKEQVDRSQNLDSAARTINELLATNNVNNGSNWNQLVELIVARDSLKNSARSYFDLRPLPALFQKDPNTGRDTGPKIASVSPHFVWRDRATTFTLQVSGLTQATNVWINGISCPPMASSPISTNGVLLTCQLEPGAFSATLDATNTLEFTVVDEGGGKMAAGTFPVAVLGTRNNATLQISRDANGKVTGLSVNVSTNVTEQSLIETARDILKTSEAPPSQVIK